MMLCRYAHGFGDHFLIAQRLLAAFDFEAPVAPVTAVAAESGDAALGGDAGAGQDGDGAGGLEGFAGCVEVSIRQN